MEIFIREDKKWVKKEVELNKKVSADKWYKMSQQTPKTKVSGQWK